MTATNIVALLTIAQLRVGTRVKLETNRFIFAIRCQTVTLPPSHCEGF